MSGFDLGKFVPKKIVRGGHVPAELGQTVQTLIELFHGELVLSGLDRGKFVLIENVQGGQVHAEQVINPQPK